MEEFGRVDVLVNNAGIGTAVPATRETPDQFRQVIDVNLNGCYWMAQACGRVMQPGSSIINISSVLGLTTAGLPQAAYASSKAGLIGLTRDLAQQWTGRKGIRVNAIAPGFFESEMTDQYPPGYLESQEPRIPVGRKGDPAELAAAVVFLASDAGRLRHRPDPRRRRRHDHHLITACFSIRLIYIGDQSHPRRLPMSVTDQLLENNEKYAAGFSGPLPLPPSKHIAVLACMDARHQRLRRPRARGGRVARDPQRGRRRDRRRDPLAGDQPAAARHQGDRADPPHRLRDAHLHRRRVHAPRIQEDDRPQARAGPPRRSATSTTDVRQSIARIKASPFVPHTDQVRGFVFDVATGRLREVA